MSGPLTAARLPLVTTPAPQDVTGLLLAWRQGDPAALERLIPTVYAELNKLARRYLRGERAGHSLQPTELVNEAYLRLIDLRNVRCQNRAHFFAMSARLMRRILVDAARERNAQRRGAGISLVTFDEALPVSSEPPADLVALDDALDALAVEHERKSRVVELKFFGGLSVRETAEVLEVSEDTVQRDWKFARTWLFRQLKHEKRTRG
ncbi:MAG TPA: sigma-70 family RNA polymerase sigma factor [Vicinamibacterales bacterium]|nr:sigma-70 family RNA polymerase sigma factor [Vicinamibacterales bacterium]